MHNALARHPETGEVIEALWFDGPMAGVLFPGDSRLWRADKVERVDPPKWEGAKWRPRPRFKVGDKVSLDAWNAHGTIIEVQRVFVSMGPEGKVYRPVYVIDWDVCDYPGAKYVNQTESLTAYSPTVT